MLNLLNNAVKFTEQGQIILQVKEINLTDTQDKSNNIVPLDELSAQICLRFIVADTGIGISQQDLSKIFQPFEQINKYEAQEVGAGLGLSTSKQLVELMGGKLNVKSEPNQGSIFWFDLAFSPIKVTSAIEAESFGEIIGYQGNQLTILIVDDVKISRLLLLDILEPLGFKVLTAKNGQQGLQLALANQPDLILTDLFMPIKTGFTLIAELRQRDNFAKTPIIAVSASSFEEVERHSRASGCNSFISKPIDDQRLLNLLGNYLNLQWIYQYSKNNQS